MKRFAAVSAALVALAALAAVQAEATPSPGFTVDPGSLSFQTGVGGYAYQTVTVTTSRAVVIQNPSVVSGYSGFSDTQSGTCWQQYESLGKQIPPHTSCTIQVNFHPADVGTFYGTLNVTRCVDWYKDPVYGFVVCTSFDGSQSVSLVGTVWTITAT